MKTLNLNKINVCLFLILAFGFDNLYAQHVFSVEYNILSQNDVSSIRTEVARRGTSAPSMSMSRNRNNKEVYSFSLSSTQNTKVVILNEETGNNVVIIPTQRASSHLELSPFFIEEIRRSILGDANRYLVIETETNFSVRNVATVARTTERVFIPTYFYGPKENVREARPEDRQITHIFRQKPKLVPAFPNDLENLRRIAELEEEMSYYVYMYRLPDGILVIYDEHFNASADRNTCNAIARSGSNLQFNLSGDLDAQQCSATVHALNIWSNELLGTIPVSINVETTNMAQGVLGSARIPPHYFNPATQTWYPSALGNQILGYNLAPDRLNINVTMNSDVDWFYNRIGTPIGNQYDWITIMLHEVTHGLGFVSLIYWNTDYPQDNGRFRYVADDGHYYPGIFDRQLYQGIMGNISLANLIPTQRAALVTSDNLYAGHQGSHLLVANGGTRVKMYAPLLWDAGSSVSHWDSIVLFQTFMKHSIGERTKLHTINEREIAIMRDMGWGWSCPAINFTNRTITTNTPITHTCGVVNINNVTITSTGSLTVQAKEVNVGNNFTVQSGGGFNINIVP